MALALQAFVRRHPPFREVRPATPELVVAYEDILPAGLIELWRRKGLGFYGDLQLALVDPRPWQPVIDRWIASPRNATQRIPVAMTPFGRLLYYRRLEPADEDVAYIDPVLKETRVLAWSLDEFFNKVLCEKDRLQTIVSPSLVQAARQRCGSLAPGEVYEVDQTLLPMQMLRIEKVDALDMHRRLRVAVDPPKPKLDKPVTLADALPIEFRPFVANPTTRHDLAGLYLSSYIDWYRLLILQPDGHYRLLFWQIHQETLERIKVRAYSGRYGVSANSFGDENIVLHIALTSDSLGSDANDHRLVVMHSDGTTLLLRGDELEGIATAIASRGVIGRSEHYFRRVAPEDALAEPSGGRVAPPFRDLPHALKALMRMGPPSNHHSSRGSEPR